MSDICFSPSQVALLVGIGGVLQGVIATLFWLAIRSKEDSIKDAREVRDRALDLNERTIVNSERQAEVVSQVVKPRGRRS